VSFIDPVAKKIKAQYPTSPFGHILEFDHNRFALSGGAPKTGMQAGLLERESGKVRDVHSTKNFPKLVSCEGLSLAALSKDKIALTLLETGQVMLWDVRQDSTIFVKMNSKEALGAAVVDGKLLVSFDKHGKVARVREDGTTQAAFARGEEFSFANGKHLKVMRF
jgi:hypothetical protein